MAQITLRLDEDLLDRIDDSTGPEESRSQWLREAARAQLTEDDIADVHDRLDRLERRVERLERPLLERLLR
jgi:metal-responsive CopG/Arc/MetJ family transcriptional regulator